VRTLLGFCAQQHTQAVAVGITRHHIDCAVAVKISNGHAKCSWSNRDRSSRRKSTASIASQHAHAVAVNRNDVHPAIAIDVSDDDVIKSDSKIEWRSIRLGKSATAIAKQDCHCVYFVMSRDDVLFAITVQITDSSKP